MEMLKNNNLGIVRKKFSQAPDGTPLNLFTLTNANGMILKATDFGGIITEIHAPDKRGQLADIVLGFDTIEPYYKDSPYFGALIGRYGNRIAEGKFNLEGNTYHLPLNNGVNHLHGGIVGFDKVVWSTSTFVTKNSVGLKLKYISHDGDQGYPGNLHVTVIYELTNENSLIIEFHGVTDKATPINLTQHTYFNLTGFNRDEKSNILGHQLKLNADNFLPINTTQIPTGEIRSVANTPFDFRHSKTIGEHINDENEQLKNGFGYDHHFILNKNEKKELSFAARVHEPISGRVIELFTQEPGIQFYSGNFLDGSLTGKNRCYRYRSGFCLEPQHAPNSPNHQQFPNTILRPGDEYTSKIVYKFSAE